MSSLSDILKDYVCMIIKMNAGELQYDEAFELLFAFLMLMTTRRDFEIKLSEVAELLTKYNNGKNVLEKNLKRHLLHKINGKDYVVKPRERQKKRGGGSKDDVWLTLKCFCDIIHKYESYATKIIQHYYFTVESAYRENMIETIRSRLSQEDRHLTTEKQQKAKTTKQREYKEGESVYGTGLWNGSQRIGMRIGMTNDMDRRLSEHDHKYPYRLKEKVQQISGKDRSAVEQMARSTLLHFRHPLDAEVYDVTREKAAEVFKDCQDAIYNLRKKHTPPNSPILERCNSPQFLYD